MITTIERIHVDHATTKRLGRWTATSSFEIKARSGSVVLDLRSPELPAELEIRIDLRRAMVKLLVPEGAVIDQWDVAWPARGRVKDAQGPTGEPAGPRIRLVGTADNSEVRIHRGGIAILSAMCSREYLEDVRRAHRTGTTPTVDDPTRA
ncbi:hypothetical protein E6W39_35370 [Kitasatospora acidiphila]|uniref:Uncharacterized protein n=1 Tax=Kitasatospora acidiphila TaxID=2567942 RepID=A0A540WDN5_9ACTN|nr:hypothetical protein [Kitasatospora acidiphila]TQF06514.1 hypothetical protein E6W39_35370 [Kitasatospora acidiphila]